MVTGRNIAGMAIIPSPIISVACGIIKCTSENGPRK
jgi:hypothetical protein